MVNRPLGDNGYIDKGRAAKKINQNPRYNEKLKESVITICVTNVPPNKP
jgi:hypothetical protein